MLALLVGGALATAALRSNLVNRLRPEMPSPAVDSAKRERESQNRLDTAVLAPAPPTEIPSSMIYGTVRIGSTCPAATLYVGELVRPIGQMGLQDIGQLSGNVRLEVRTPTGARWDTTMTVESGVTYTVGFRPLRCQ